MFCGALFSSKLILKVLSGHSVKSVSSENFASSTQFHHEIQTARDDSNLILLFKLCDLVYRKPIL